MWEELWEAFCEFAELSPMWSLLVVIALLIIIALIWPQQDKEE